MEEGHLKTILRDATVKGVADIHLVVNRPPIFRLNGELMPSTFDALSAEDIKSIIYSLLNEKQRKQYDEQRDVDFSYFGLTEAQFRVNAYYEKGLMAATFRITPTVIGSQEELNIPDAVKKLAMKRKGLVIFSGTSGSGKTTSMSFLVDIINKTRKAKIITIEDPIEYVHKSDKSLIVQREVGVDTQSFETALKYSLRQDPDVVVIGEMRDLESISMALTTAETGHLVLSTVHAPDAVETINRIIDVYPAHKREQIFVQLAENLQGVISQTLVPQKDSDKRILCTEVLLTTMAIRNMIRRGALVEIRGQLDAEYDIGTHSYEACLSQFYRKGLITMETAREYANHPHLLKL